MAEPLTPDAQSALERVRAIALELPEAEERLSHGQPTFFVADKMFAQFRHNHHGDGRTIVAVKTDGDDDARMLIEAAAAQYGRVSHFGAAWVGMALDAEADWVLVGDRVAHSWELAAPARLLEAGGR